MKQETNPFPKTKLQWLWENMKGCRGIYFVGMAGTVVYNILQLTVPYFSGKIVDLFLTGENARENLSTHRDLFYQLILAMVLFTLLRCVIVYGVCMIYEHVSQTVLYRVRNYLYDKIQRQDMTFYSTYRTGDLMTRLTGDLDAIRHMVAWIIRMVIESFSLFAAAAIFFLYTNWKMALCLLVIAPFVFWIIYLFRNKVAPMHALLREKLSQMNTCAQENISGNRVVKAFAREDYEIEKFDKANRDFCETNKATAMVWLKFFPYVETIANLMPLVMLGVGGVFLIKGLLTMGEYVAFSGLIWAIANPMRQMGNIMNEFQRFSAASRKVMELYYSEPKIKDHEDAKEHPDRFDGKIEFKNVSFQYEDGDLPVLHNISFTVNPGETVAIMGETGCGKTSLINLIPRFYDATEGRVEIMGRDVRSYPREALRGKVAVVMQKAQLFGGTIRSNLLWGNKNATDAELWAALETAQAAEFVKAKPLGLDEPVEQGGRNLSGGQKQRLTIARALVGKPDILILDDSASALDYATDAALRKALAALPGSLTVFIVSQRAASLQHADQILVLDDGRLVGLGTHDQLRQSCPVYEEIYESQFKKGDVQK